MKNYLIKSKILFYPGIDIFTFINYILKLRTNNFEIFYKSSCRDRGYLPLVLEALCAIFVKLSINVENAKIVDLI